MISALVCYCGSFALQGLSPAEIADGYEEAMEATLRILPELVVEKVEDLHDVTKVQRALLSSVASKQYGNHDMVARLVAQACGIR